MNHETTLIAEVRAQLQSSPALLARLRVSARELEREIEERAAQLAQIRALLDE